MYLVETKQRKTSVYTRPEQSISSETNLGKHTQKILPPFPNMNFSYIFTVAKDRGERGGLASAGLGFITASEQVLNALSALTFSNRNVISGARDSCRSPT